VLKKRKTTRLPAAAPSRNRALDCVPVKNPQVREEADRKGELRLHYQVQVRPWFQGVVKKITRSESSLISRSLQLDPLGTSVWQMIDGEQTVKNIIDEFQATHQLNRREAEVSVTTFFKELGKRGLLAMRER
jgi:hypothetical protein